VCRRYVLRGSARYSQRQSVPVALVHAIVRQAEYAEFYTRVAGGSVEAVCSYEVWPWQNVQKATEKKWRATGDRGRVF